MLPLFVRGLTSLLLTPVFLLALPQLWLFAPSTGGQPAPAAVPLAEAVAAPPASRGHQPPLPTDQAEEAPPAAVLVARVITVVLQAPAYTLASSASPPLPTAPAAPTPQPSAPVAGEPDPALSQVNTDRLNLRAGPGTVYPVIGEADFGTALRLVGRNDDCTWLQVRTSTDALGWSLAAYVTPVTDCAQLPILAVEPPSAPNPPVALAAAQAAVADSQAPPAPSASCGTIPEAHYELLSIEGTPTARPAAQHPDINLALRDYAPTQAELAVIEFDAADDPLAPQLAGLFADRRIPALQAVYQVFDWDWGCDCRGPLLAQRGASLAGLAVQPGETIYTPDSGRGLGSGYEVLVLYADERQLTLKYTREDNVVAGYTLHLAGLCVEPRLLALYQTANQAGRGQLPALRAGQAVGQAAGAELKLAIRDTGDFMDPRDQEDWWRVR